MHRLREVPLLIQLMALTGAAMLLPAIHAAVLRDHALARSFLYTAALIWVLCGMLGIATARHRPRNAAHSHLVAVAAAYLILPPLMALPLVPQEGGGLPFGAAWFEMLSAFTTTGGSLFAPGDLAMSVHLWRALAGWLGGFYILVMALAVLAPLNLGGMEVVSGRTPGRGAKGASQITEVAGASQRMLRFAAGLFPVYGGLTLLLWLLLIIAGEDSLIAFCHAMSTLSTSGISPVGGLQGGQAGFAGEALIFLFLGLALSRRTLMFLVGHGSDRPFYRDAELRTAAVILFWVTLLLFLRLWWGASMNGRGSDLPVALQALWGRLFMALSFLTTTGFTSASWAGGADWAGLEPAGMALWGLVIIGGGIATTAGGVKLLRVAGLYRHATEELQRLVHPSAVAGVFGGKRQVARDGAFLAWVSFMLFALAIAFFCGALTATGTGFEDALVLTLAGLTNTGPLTETVPGLMTPWPGLDSAERVILGFAMIVGRLETLAILALLLPDAWRN